MTKLSDKALADVIQLASKHTFVTAFSVLQLVDDNDQCTLAAMAITKTMLAMTVRLAEIAHPELDYERTIKVFADQIIADLVTRQLRGELTC